MADQPDRPPWRPGHMQAGPHGTAASRPFPLVLPAGVLPFSYQEINLRLDAAVYASGLLAAADAAGNAGGGGLIFFEIFRLKSWK